ncbi:hypothetical protein [Proteiniphilum sp.]|nr:hypothetical protein [Proteiniphilum sp.]MEA4917542.1 hypothetical protein [Proteiniphilum sp.]
MKKLSKIRFILTCMLVLVLGECIDQFQDLEKDGSSDEQQLTQTTSIKDAIFHEQTNSWIKPRTDPYTLANFQKAYENLISYESGIRLVSEELSNLGQLKATHYALKIYPKNEDEQWEIELMDDINVAYVPFDYTQ